jgi:hypothetical protein
MKLGVRIPLSSVLSSHQSSFIGSWPYLAFRYFNSSMVNIIIYSSSFWFCKVPIFHILMVLTDCKGRGETPCPTCNTGQQHGFYKANHIQCSACQGRGLVSCQDGSDESDTVLVLPLIFIQFISI